MILWKLQSNPIQSNLRKLCLAIVVAGTALFSQNALAFYYSDDMCSEGKYLFPNDDIIIYKEYVKQGSGCSSIDKKEYNYYQLKDIKGKLIGTYKNIAFYTEMGLIAVQSDGKWQYIDTTGKVVTPSQYDGISPFSESLAGVKQNGKWGFIDKTGKVVIPFQYDDISPFSESLAGVTQNGKWGFINKTGKVVIPLKYKYAFTFSKGKAKVKLNDEFFYIDKTGKRLP